MKNFKKIWLASFLSIYLLAGLLLFIPNKSQAAEGGMFDITQNINFTPQVGIPDSEFITEEPVAVGGTGINAKGETVVRSDLLAKYINAFYKWGLSIVAVIAVMVLMAGGLMWIVSGGESGTVNKAKDMIFGSLTGMALLVGAWFFLNTINPQLTQLPALEMVIINKTSLGCCQYSDVAKMESDTDCKKNGGTPKLSEIDADSGEPMSYVSSGDKCVLPGCCISNAGTANAVCKNKLQAQCTSGNTFVLKSCNSLISTAKCRQGDLCQGAANGSLCSTGKQVPVYSIITSGENDYCYNNICWTGNGRENEPCGEESNAACSKEFSFFNNPNDDNSSAPTAACTKPGYKHDNFGGRSCGTGTGLDLVCCYPTK